MILLASFELIIIKEVFAKDASHETRVFILIKHGLVTIITIALWRVLFAF